MYDNLYSIDGKQISTPRNIYRKFIIETTHNRITTIHTRMDLVDVVELLTRHKRCILTDELGNYICLFRKHIVKVKEIKK